MQERQNPQCHNPSPPSCICVCLLHMVLSLAGLQQPSVPSLLIKERCCACDNPQYRLHVPVVSESLGYSERMGTI